jgi:hypothetical protein
MVPAGHLFIVHVMAMFVEARDMVGRNGRAPRLPG